MVKATVVSPVDSSILCEYTYQDKIVVYDYWTLLPNNLNEMNLSYIIFL